MQLNLKIYEGQNQIGVLNAAVQDVDPVWKSLTLKWKPNGSEAEIVTQNRPVKNGRIKAAIIECASFIDGEIREFQELDAVEPQKPVKPAKLKDPDYDPTLKGRMAIKRRWENMTAEEKRKRLEPALKASLNWWKNLSEDKKKAMVQQRLKNLRKRWASKNQEQLDKYSAECSFRQKRYWSSLTPEQKKIRTRNIGRKKRKNGRLQP